MGLLDKLKSKAQDVAPAGVSKKKGRKVMVLGLDCAPPEHIVRIVAQRLLHDLRAAKVNASLRRPS